MFNGNFWPFINKQNYILQTILDSYIQDYLLSSVDQDQSEITKKALKKLKKHQQSKC